MVIRPQLRRKEMEKFMMKKGLILIFAICFIALCGGLSVYADEYDGEHGGCR